MPRQLRIEYPGAIYHVTNRGDRRKPIFHDDFDRKRFDTTLADACAKTDWQVYAYVSYQTPRHFPATQAGNPSSTCNQPALLVLNAGRYGVESCACS